jgi:tetratricopeptide (TPR) repeat protein
MELILEVLERQDSDLEEEGALCEMAHEIHPGNAIVSAELGEILWLLDENDEARAVLEDGVRRNADDAQLNYLLGLVLDTEFGDVEGGRRHLRRAVELKPKNAPYRRALASALTRGGDLQGAEENYRAALELEPGNLLSHRDLGVFLMEAKRYDEARRELEEAEELDDEEDARTHVYLAKAIMMTTGSKAKALEQFERALEIDPHDHEARREFAIFLLDHYDSAREAKALYQEYLKRNPDSVRARLDYALLLEERFHDVMRARRHLEKALELDPENAICAKMLKELDQETGPAKKPGDKVKKA